MIKGQMCNNTYFMFVFGGEHGGVRVSGAGRSHSGAVGRECASLRKDSEL